MPVLNQSSQSTKPTYPDPGLIVARNTKGDVCYCSKEQLRFNGGALIKSMGFERIGVCGVGGEIVYDEGVKPKDIEDAEHKEQLEESAEKSKKVEENDEADEAEEVSTGSGALKARAIPARPQKK